jgi:hypothetical protein
MYINMRVFVFFSISRINGEANIRKFFFKMELYLFIDTCINIYGHIYVINVYIYLYIYTHIYVYICIYMYIYI